MHDHRGIGLEPRLRIDQELRRRSSLIVSEIACGQAKLNHVPRRVLEVDACAESMVDLEHAMAVLLPTDAMSIECFACWCVEGNVVDPAREARGLVDVHFIVVADVIAFDLPECNEVLGRAAIACAARESSAGLWVLS